MKTVISSLCLCFAFSALAQPLMLKKNKEILKTFETLTGVASTDFEIMDLYRASFLSLPKDGNLAEMTPFSLLAMSNLGSLFCEKMVQADRKREMGDRWVHGDLNLDKDVNSWSEADVDYLVDNYGMAFWNRTPEAKERALLHDIFDTMKTDQQPVAQTAALTSTCLSMLVTPIVYTK